MSNDIEKISFEEAVKRLEKVVRALEAGEVPLEQALELFQEGVGLVKVCSNKLDEAEKKIQVLVEDTDGKLRLERSVSLEEGA